ncbi:MAG: hypothetical protein K6F52_05320 [Clostridia bacterium]|nr:hypothetical protein [Clostridia bacterium]
MQMKHRSRYFVILALILSLLLSTSAVFAAANPNVTIASPVSGSTVSSSSLLVSVKVTAPTTIKVGVAKLMKTADTPATAAEYEKAVKEGTLSSFTTASVFQDEPFKTKNNLSFYTKKLENMSPGVYRVKVETLGSAGTAVYSSSRYVIMKSEASAAVDFSSTQPGAVQFLQGLLKSIFN